MKRRGRLSHEAWCELIAEQEAGELSIVEFCRRRGLAEHSFHYHRGRLRRRSAQSGFREVVISRPEGLSLRLDDEGWRVDVRPGFDAAQLRELVQALR